MKTFLVIFAAVLCALVVAFFGLRMFGRYEAWEGEKAGALENLRACKSQLADTWNQLKSFPDNSDTAEAGALKDNAAKEAARIVDGERDLLGLYGNKLLPLSDEEKRQVAEWRQDVTPP